MINLRIGKLLRRAEQPVARIADSDVDPTHSAECTVHGRADADLVRKIEHRHRQAVAMLRLQIGEGALTSYRAHDPIAAGEQAPRHQPAETRRRAGDEPGLTHDDDPFRCPGVE
jgi:hypothetical protein